MLSGLVRLWGNCEAGITIFTPETAMAHGYAQARKLPLTKGNKSWSFPRGGGRSRTGGSLWLWALAVTHCGRFFFFFFFFFFFQPGYTPSTSHTSSTSSYVPPSTNSVALVLHRQQFSTVRFATTGAAACPLGSNNSLQIEQRQARVPTLVLRRPRVHRVVVCVTHPTTVLSEALLMFLGS
eukprot:FR739187.1.p1 GENE.FR739187.1~~FR739187.1.p1  ORF type:complete len:181 (-),score=21.44 FR739187.1:412-954(-)